MNITYVLLSPTFGMHQYTADLAGRMADGELQIADGRPQVRLVTTARLPRDRYSPAVQVETPLAARGTGFSREGLDLAAYRRVRSGVRGQASGVSGQASGVRGQASGGRGRGAAIVHFTGVHAWNLPLVRGLRREGIPVVHTLHDLDPHSGVRYPALIRLWNRLIIASGCHLLVHSRRACDQIIARGVLSERVTYAPLLHGFLAAERAWPPAAVGLGAARGTGSAVNVLFFGRIEAYKGVEDLLAAWGSLAAGPETGESAGGMAQAGRLRYNDPVNLVIAGPAARGIDLGELPPGAELRDRRIMDDEAEALFRVADLLVLPYRDATQSALIAAAYAFEVPVIVTSAGALPEYVVAGETGWIVPPNDPEAFAAALREALADRNRLRAMGAAGRAWFIARRQEEVMTLGDMYRVCY